MLGLSADLQLAVKVRTEVIGHGVQKSLMSLIFNNNCFEAKKESGTVYLY